MTPQPRPTFLTVGIVLHALHAGLMLLVAALGALVSTGFLGAEVLGGAQLEVPGIAFLIGSTVAAAIGIFYVAILWVCSQAWDGSRPGVIALLVLSVLGIVNTGALSGLVGLITIIGAVQFLAESGETAGVAWSPDFDGDA